MNKLLTTGIIAGSVIGAGMMMVAQDKKAQKQVMKTGKKFMSKASDAFDNMTSSMTNMVK